MSEMCVYCVYMWRNLASQRRFTTLTVMAKMLALCTVRCSHVKTAAKVACILRWCAPSTLATVDTDMKLVASCKTSVPVHLMPRCSCEAVVFSVILRPGTGVEYCDEYVCLSVYGFVCLYVSIFLHQIFCGCCLWMWLSQSTFVGIVIRHVLPVLYMTSCFHIMGPMVVWCWCSSFTNWSFVHADASAVWYWQHHVLDDGICQG